MGFRNPLRTVHSLSTAPAGQRIVISSDQADQIDFLTGDAQEYVGGRMYVGIVDQTMAADGSGQRGYVGIAAPEIGGPTINPNNEAGILVYGRTRDGALAGDVYIGGDNVHVTGFLYLDHAQGTQPSMAARRDYVDSSVAAAGNSSAIANTVMRRDANGNTYVATPTAAGHAATKGYVDGRTPQGDPGWTLATYQNSWTTYTASSEYAPARYKFLASGEVEIQGLVQGGTPSTSLPVFTLPSAYWPSKRIMKAAIGNNAIARIDVDQSGRVFVAVGSTIFSSMYITYTP